MNCGMPLKRQIVFLTETEWALGVHSRCDSRGPVSTNCVYGSRSIAIDAEKRTVIFLIAPNAGTV